MHEIVCIGEALVDWLCLERTLDLGCAQNFVKAPGGAPANAAVALARLGLRSRFAGGFGDDVFGPWLRAVLESEGVDCSLSQNISNANTRQAYVLTDEKGDRRLLGFTKAACADELWCAKPETLVSLRSAAALVFGSVVQTSKTGQAMISDTLAAVGGSGPLRVFDPNIRLCQWSSSAEAVQVSRASMKHSDVIKLSDDELALLSGGGDIESAARKIFEEFQPALLAVTLGAKGSYFMNARAQGFVSGFRVKAVEMTGAGDAFLAGLLAGIFDRASDQKPDAFLRRLDAPLLQELFWEANALGALTTTRTGAMTSLPTRAEWEAFRANSG